MEITIIILNGNKCVLNDSAEQFVAVVTFYKKPKLVNQIADEFWEKLAPANVLK